MSIGRIVGVAGCVKCAQLDRKLGLLESELTLAARRAVAAGRADLQARAVDAKTAERCAATAFRQHLADEHEQAW